MGATNAERQRRYRLHKRGDHSLCDPNRCSPDAVTPSRVTPVTDDGKPVPPARLRARGKRLWAQLVGDTTPHPSELVLIEEACRLVDRLDRMDAIVNGADRAWLTLEVSDDGTEITVVVDKVLSEARQQQLTLKQILGELRQMQGGGQGRQPGPRRPAVTGTGGGGGGGVADLGARIAQRRANAAG